MSVRSSPQSALSVPRRKAPGSEERSKWKMCCFTRFNIARKTLRGQTKAGSYPKSVEDRKCFSFNGISAATRLEASGSHVALDCCPCFATPGRRRQQGVSARNRPAPPIFEARVTRAIRNHRGTGKPTATRSCRRNCDSTRRAWKAIHLLQPVEGKSVVRFHTFGRRAPFSTIVGIGSDGFFHWSDLAGHLGQPQAWR